MTILQGVQGYLDGSLKVGVDEEGESPAVVEEEEEGDQPSIEVVYKKGIRVDGSNEPDRDAALSEVSRRSAIRKKQLFVINGRVLLFFLLTISTLFITRRRLRGRL